MDSFFENEFPPNAHSTPNSRHEDSQMEEDPDISVRKPSNVSTSEYQELNASSTIDSITGRMQELVENINNRRTSDQKVMDSFHGKLVETVTDASQQMKEHMYTVYEENSHEMQVKLQELSEVLESCTKLHKELQDAIHTLSSLSGGLALNETPEESTILF